MLYDADVYAYGTQVAEALYVSDDGEFAYGLGIADGESSGNKKAKNRGVAASEIDVSSLESR